MLHSFFLFNYYNEIYFFFFFFFCPTSIEFSAWILRNARSTLGRYAHTVGLMSPSVTCILLMRMRPVTRCPGVCNWQRAHWVHESWLSTATISARLDFRSSFPPRACSDDRGDMKIRFTPVPYSGRDSSWGGTSLHGVAIQARFMRLPSLFNRAWSIVKAHARITCLPKWGEIECQAVLASWHAES